jgi:heterotetrameric sarcosine oxidase gamma subunit
MAERQSALAHLPPTPAGGGRVTLSELRAGSIMQVQAWPDTAETVGRVIAHLFGGEAPVIGTALVGAGVTIAAIAPGRYLVSSDAGDLAQKFEAALPSSDAGVSDISHGRVILKLDGEAAASVLATSVALDLNPSVFPAGRVVQTMIHHIDVVIHRRSETHFELWVLRSFAEALAEWLIDQGLEFGIGFAKS